MVGSRCGCCRFANTGKRLLQRRYVGFSSVEGDSDGLGIEVADDVLHAFFKGDIFHDFVAATLAMEVHIEDDGLFVHFGISRRESECQRQNGQKK